MDEQQAGNSHCNRKLGSLAVSRSESILRFRIHRIQKCWFIPFNKVQGPYGKHLAMIHPILHKWKQQVFAKITISWGKRNLPNTIGSKIKAYPDLWAGQQVGSGVLRISQNCTESLDAHNHGYKGWGKSSCTHCSTQNSKRLCISRQWQIAL